MLIKFTSKNGPAISMFEADAQWMLKAMEQSGTVPSAMHPDDIPAALEHLQSQVLLSKEYEVETEVDPVDDESEHVNVGARAYPLIELLKTANQHHDHVMWDFQ